MTVLHVDVVHTARIQPNILHRFYRRLPSQSKTVVHLLTLFSVSGVNSLEPWPRQVLRSVVVLKVLVNVGVDDADVADDLEGEKSILLSL